MSFAIIYILGFFVTPIICGWVFGYSDEISDGVIVTFIAALWPLVLPVALTSFLFKSLLKIGYALHDR